MEPNFYVYILRRPDKVDQFDKNRPQPFYVGKGSYDRITSHRYEANGLKNKPVRKIIKIKIIHKLWKQGMDFIEEIFSNNLTEKQAFDLECQLINKYGRIDNNTGVLANMTDGGDGPAGAKRTEEDRERYRKACKNRSSEYYKKIGAKHKGKIVSVESRKKMSESAKNRSEEAKQKNSESHKGKKLSEEHRRRIGEGLKGRICSEETRRKISEAQKGKKKCKK